MGQCVGTYFILGKKKNNGEKRHIIQNGNKWYHAMRRFCFYGVRVYSNSNVNKTLRSRSVSLAILITMMLGIILNILQ